jgi:hypothetical protein
MCRQQLFMRNDVAEVLRIFTAPGFEMDTFGLPTPSTIDISHIAPLSGHLIPAILSTDEETLTIINIDVVTVALTLAGNTAMIVADLHERPMEAKQREDFRHILRAMYAFLLGRDRVPMSVQMLPMAILAGVEEELQCEGHAVDLNQFLIDDISELEESPAKRAVQMAFFVTWVLWRRFDREPTDTGTREP